MGFPGKLQKHMQSKREVFPFDKQKCKMVFRSMTADRSLLEIYTKNIESDAPEKG